MARITKPDALARLKYARHKAQSKFRRIGFHFTYEQWLAWWSSHGIDKNLDIKWQGGQRPCMCRYGDVGDYEIDNVYLAMDNENVRDASANDRNQYRRRYVDLNWRWGDQLLTLVELRQKEGFQQRNLKFYRRENYDTLREWESHRLHRQWMSMPNKYTKFFQDTQGEWHRSIALAAKASDLTKQQYQHKLDMGLVERQRCLTGLSLRDYILSKTRYPDPIIPN
jgi:hypothetical protein